MQVAGDSVESAQAAHSTTVVAAAPPPPPPPPPPDQLRTMGGGGAFGFIELLLALGVLALARARRLLARSARPAFAVGLLSAFACSAQAQDDFPGWYLGAKFGQTQADASAARLEQALASLGHDVEATMDTTDTGWAVFGGYRFLDHFAVEAGYVDLGQITATIRSDVQTQAQFQELAADTARVHPYSFDGYTLAGIVNVALRNVSVFAKVGLIHWQADAAVPMPSPGPVADLSEDGTDALVGAGLAYNWAKHWGLRAEWERYSAERNDVDLTSLSLMYRF
jgi:OOP family OmpA-OmpF porin